MLERCRHCLSVSRRFADVSFDAIVSEACHAVKKLRVEVALLHSEKAENRGEFANLRDYLERSSGRGTGSADELLSRFLPNLQRNDYALPVDKAAQAAGEEESDEKEMATDPLRRRESDRESDRLRISPSNCSEPPLFPVASRAAFPPSSDRG